MSGSLYKGILQCNTLVRKDNINGIHINVLLLSLGLKVAAQKFPLGLITGTLPPSCRPPPPPQTSRSSKKVQKVKTPPQIPADKTTFMADDILYIIEIIDS